MIIIFFFFLLSSLYSCEQTIYGTYKIIEGNSFEVRKKNTNIYTVKSGDNLFLIAKKNFVSVKDLINLNNIESPFKIYPKQKLILPELNTHKVLKGETIYSISRKYDVDRYQLSKVNKLTSENKIFVGNRLFIPSTKKILKKEKITVKKKKNIKKKNQNNSIFFQWPVNGNVILNYGMIKPGLHNDGINIKAKKGENVIASSGGKIIYAGNEIPGYGNLVLIKHSDNWITAYAHLEKIFLDKGTIVNKGENIGTVGSSGNVKIPQLHFEIRKGKKALNPSEFLS
ncbi:MAG: peptidase M23 [Rickettsiales bacterium]|nr:peptidase M23 [Rickettsiales bacterium]